MLELDTVSSPQYAQELDVAKKTIEELYSKYSADSHVFAKMHNYVRTRLPLVIEDMKRTSDERRLRNEHLSTEQDTFIHTFLNEHRYYYCSQTDIFFYYDGEQYSIRKEDDVLHHILTSITKECYTLLPRKPQTKVYIMKRIKDNNPLKSLPETITIQSLLDSICPSLFYSKSAAKYFLNVIGDHLLKKADDSLRVYFTTNKARDFLRELAQLSQSIFGVNAVSSFKYKYHDHPYRTMRMVKMNDSVESESTWRTILQSKYIDIFFVAAYYSNLYESADQYLYSHSDDFELTKHAFYFRWKTGKEIVDDFISEYLFVCDVKNTTDVLPNNTFMTNQTTDNKLQIITATTMEYLWKKYLKEKQFPAVSVENGWLTAIAEVFPEQYNEEKNIFIGIGSTHLHGIDKEKEHSICKS